MPVELKDSFTSTGQKFFAHQEAMKSLQNGKGMPITCHVIPTDTCQHTCAMCSVATREGNILAMREIEGFLDQLVPLGLKSVIISGGGNPILYRCKETKSDFNDLVDMIHGKGLELGLISNGAPMKEYPDGRTSWKMVRPETLDKFTWIRISMSGLDHDERTVYVPDIDPNKTTLGFSYVYHDIYHEKNETHHGKVATPEEVIEPGQKIEMAIDRIPWLTEQFKHYVGKHSPTYLRLLPNCNQPALIDERCELLRSVANEVDPTVAFVQYKKPKAPHACYLGYIHPVLNSDGFIFPCDSTVLAAAAINRHNHKFDTPWRVCHWTEIGEYFSRPVKSMVDSQRLCAGCVFNISNAILERVVEGGDFTPPETPVLHQNFV